MGQKTHPYGFRLGVTKTWRSRWFAKQDYARLLEEDLDLKDELRSRLKAASVSSVEVDRPGNKLRITIRTSRPGIIIGRKGAEIEKLKSEMAKRTKREVFIDIQEVSKPDVDAQLVHMAQPLIDIEQLAGLFLGLLPLLQREKKGPVASATGR